MSVFLARTDLIQLALTEVLTTIAPTQWAYGEPSADALPAAVFTLRWGSAVGDQVSKRASSIYTVASLELDVLSSSVGEDLAVSLNDIAYRVTATDASPATLRGLLLAALQADTGAFWEAIGVGGTGIRVTPTGSGTLLNAKVIAGGGLVSYDVDHASQPHEVTRTTRAVSVELHAWAASTSPRASANLLADHGATLLQGPLAVAALQRRGGVIRNWERAVDLTRLAGARWKSRAVAPFVLAYETQLVTPATKIQSTPFLMEISA